MFQENKGLLLQSNPFTWVNGANLDIDRNFLKEAMGRMRAPVVRELQFHVDGQVTGVTATLLAKDGHKFFERIQVGDRGGLLFDCSGAVARHIEQMELGSKAFEPNNGTAIASAATSGNYHVMARVLFDTERSHRGADTALPLNHLMDGGKIAVRCATPPGCTVTSATIRVYAVVHDERERELKSRQVWKEFSITKAEDSYSIGGSLRAAFISSTLTATGYTALDAEVATITSKTLGLSQYDLIQFILEYRRLRDSASSVDGFLSSITAPDAVSLVNPSRGQHIGKMADLQSMHLKLVSAPTSGALVTCHIEDRNLSLAAEWMGYDSEAAFLADFNARARVSSRGKAGTSIKSWPASLVRRLPAVIPAEG